MRAARALVALQLLAIAAVPASRAAATVAAPAASEASWRAAYGRALRDHAAGAFPAAEGAAREALALARAGGAGNRPFVAASLNLLALARERQGDGAQAVELLRQALAASQEAPGEQANAASVALNLGHALDAMARFDEAVAAYRQGLLFIGEPPANPEAAPVRHQLLAALARVHAARGQAEESAHYNERLLGAGAGAAPAVQADAFERQAQRQRQEGALDAARASFEQALALRERASPPDTQALLRALGGLAGVLGQMGAYDQAEPLHRRAVALLEGSDPQGIVLAGHLNELGLWHLQRKDFARAQDLLQRARALVEAQAPRSLATARIVANQAQLHEAGHDDRQAQALYREAMALYASHGDAPEALLGQAQALNFLAGYDYRRRRLAQAEAQFMRALALTEQAEGAQSPRLLPLLDNLVALYRSQQRPMQAAPHAERAAALRKLAPEPGR